MSRGGGERGEEGEEGGGEDEGDGQGSKLQTTEDPSRRLPRAATTTTTTTTEEEGEEGEENDADQEGGGQSKAAATTTTTTTTTTAAAATEGPSSRLGVELTDKRLMERRLSGDMSGGLFDRQGPGGRRQSILVPPGQAPLALAPGGGGGGGGGARRGAPQPAQGKPGPAGKARPGDRARGRSASFLKTPQPGTLSSRGGGGAGGGGGGVGADRGPRDAVQVGRHTLPAFVQVETLHPGQVFVSIGSLLLCVVV